MFSSSSYWEKRYKSGGHSGNGSQGLLLDFKCRVINGFIIEKKIISVIDFGCGDGRLTNCLRCEIYLGYDISTSALLMCQRQRRTGKHFFMVDDYNGEAADLALSIDVIFHLVEDDVFESYMARLFNAADKFVILYTSNTDDNTGMSEHVRHRKVVEWVAENQPAWQMFRHIKNPHPYEDDPNGSFCDFYFYKKREVNG